MRKYKWSSEEYDDTPAELINIAEMVEKVDSEVHDKKMAEARHKTP